MSAIWGAVSLAGGRLPDGLEPRMRRYYDRCVIDAFGSYHGEDVAMGCGVQHITPEARGERMPIADPEGGFVFAADILLDNRPELLARLGMDSAAADGDIACELLAREGEGSLPDLLGAFALVRYDRRRRTVTMALDATGNRCLYYKVREGVLYFSSLIAPILEAAGSEGVNQRWLSDFLALDNFATLTEYEETAYAGVRRLRPGHVFTVTEDGRVSGRKYWNPDTTTLILEDDRAYAQRLREIYGESIRCLLRADKTGLMLSGGLDSTSAACYAARMLRDEGKPLYTFTSVPEPDYAARQSPGTVEDERGYVLETKDYLEADGCRLECEFLDLAGVNAWDARGDELAMLEFPYKSMQNILWTPAGLRSARAKGVRLALNASFGNVTISSGAVDPYFYELLRRGRILECFRQVRRFCRAAGWGRREELKHIAGVLRGFFAGPRVRGDGQEALGGSYLSREAAERHGTLPRLLERANAHEEQNYSYRANREALDHELLFAIKGEIATKHSLWTGVVSRDPTMDRRVVEFCMRLPPGQTARDGVSRRLVVEYMKDDLPPHIQRPRFGRQSADTVDRLQKHWPRIHRELGEIYRRNTGGPLVDCGRALDDLDRLAEISEETGNFDLLRLCYTALALEFAEVVNRAGDV